MASEIIVVAVDHRPEELLLEGGYYAELERVQREGGQDGDLKNKRAGVR